MGCLFCTDPKACDACNTDNGFVAPDAEGQCQCDKDKWISKDQSNCTDCSTVIEHCATCNTNVDERSTSCDVCDETFFSKGDQCAACSENCLQCTSETDCTQCADTYYLKKKSCTLCSQDFLKCVSCDIGGCTKCEKNYHI